MQAIDLRETTDDDGFVIYFGGEPNQVDTYTFANALVAIADAFREINSQVNPGTALELSLEAVAEGSFKARVKGLRKPIGGLLASFGKQVVLPILLAFLYDEMKGEEKISVNSGEVVIRRGKDRIVIPRDSYDSAKYLPNKPAVRSHIAKALAIVSADNGVESFGILKDFDKKTPPLIIIPRSEFDRVREIESVDDPSRRDRDERATVYVLKAVFQASNRKWEFVWNGIKISAPIHDAAFLAALLQRQYLIGNGDALEVDLRVSQRWDATSGVWLNDAYSVQKVYSHVPANPPRQTGMFEA